MKRILLAAALSLLAGGAFAQPTAPTGQALGGAINAGTFAANNDASGFNDIAVSLLAVPGTSTTQATFGTGSNNTGALLTGTVITTRTTVITACSGTTGVTLPALQHYVPISILNRSGGSCLIWPSLGTTVETALGTDGATNAAFTMLTNTDIIFRPVPTAAGGVKWMQ